MDPMVAKLGCAATRHACEGLVTTPIANFGLLKVSRETDLPPEIYRPVVSLIVQGEKQLTIGTQVLTYRAGDTFTTSLDLPVSARITRASPERPYLAISFAIDAGLVGDMFLNMPDPAEPLPERGFAVDRAGSQLLDVYGRALFLLDQPEDASVMAPLLERELVYRLLKGPQGAALRRLVTGTHAIAGVREAIERIGQSYKDPFSVEEIARAVGMSASAFHRHFRTATGITPLQYQKTLRLYEARRLLVTQSVTVGSAAFSVGYQSVSQFTREYRRMFAAPPGRDTRPRSSV
ncbi:AraC family transcriptional regulator [Aurantiacibacter suaedae]|uniref:AraC family transcriptional regulator n=1 Tax=Aurantiacibacter suaedae TaxID=2545755 RepID=UPI0010F5E53E|nr:AraC family transcriptional regulator [Aurantiacibacter suaedae]